MTRDARADGTFVLAVRSTHIYCRPSCPARRPLRRNVVFFHTGAEAEKEGFRPCLRCRPNEVAGGVGVGGRAAAAHGECGGGGEDGGGAGGGGGGGGTRRWGGGVVWRAGVG